jgi:hypothetical protein
LPVSAIMVAWWTSRSIKAAATIASPDLARLLEAAVGGDGDRAAFIAARDEREERVDGLVSEREVADLVDDEQVVALKPAARSLSATARRAPRSAVCSSRCSTRGAFSLPSRYGSRLLTFALLFIGLDRASASPTAAQRSTSRQHCGA